MIERMIGSFVMFIVEPDESQKHREEIVPMIFHDESASYGREYRC